MLVPAIDLRGGRVVQLVRGKDLAVATDDLDGWIDRFRPFPLVQVIDLDAAMSEGGNDGLVARVCRALPCQVGGGVRSVERARRLLSDGARRVILGSAIVTSTGVDLAAARRFSDAVGVDRLVAAVDSRGGRVTIHGWKTMTSVTAPDAVAALSPFVGAFLYTHVDTEGTLTGIDLDAVEAVRQATGRPLIVAGGIRSVAEIEQLDTLGIDAVVGMAIYTGLIDLSAVTPTPPDAGNTPPKPSV